jgi:hypothetical protein
MRPGGGQPTDIVRVQPTTSAPTPVASAAQLAKVRAQQAAAAASQLFLREHGMAGLISACYVFILVFLQIGLTKWSGLNFTLAC